MPFLANRTVNLLNLHYGIHALALSSGAAFFAAFLVRSGVPPAAVFGALALIFMARASLRPLVLELAKRWGLKPLVIAGTIVTGLQYPVLAEVHALGPMLLVLCAFAAAGDVLYWTAYHAYFAALGDPEHRGHQIGAREAAAAVVGVIGPLLTGWALVAFGPRIAFAATAAVMCAGAIPLLFAPNVAVARQAEKVGSWARTSIFVFASDGWGWGLNMIVWQVALFLSLGQNFAAFGGALAVAAFVGAVSGLLLGRWIDMGNGARAVWVHAAVAGTTILLRAATYADPFWAPIVNAATAISTAFSVPTIMTAIYNQSRRSPCPLRFSIATEGGFDAGAASGCLVAAGLTLAGAPFWLLLLLALGGAATTFAILRGHYQGEAARAVA